MSKIEWCDRTINPIRGLCPHECPYCYMSKMHKRFGTGEKTTYHFDTAVKTIVRNRKAKSIFVGSANDLFSEKNIEHCNKYFGSDDSFFLQVKNLIDWNIHYRDKQSLIFLTKNPKAYEIFRTFRTDIERFYLKNSFYGASLDGKHYTDFNGGQDLLDFISVEPLLAPVKMPETSARAIIIGGLTGHGSPYKHTPIEWVDKLLLDALCVRGMKVFIKDNLKDYIAPLEAKYGVSLRQLLWKVRG